MLLSKTKDEWDLSYSSATALLEIYHRKLQILKDIYSRISYYAGYFTADIQDNLNLHGIPTAESNHAAVVRHFGASGVWSIVYHIKRLLEIQTFYIKSGILKNDRIYMSNCIESDFDGGLARYDEYAQQSLSHYAYHNLWLMTVRKDHKLRFKSTDELLSYIVWLVGERQTENDSTIIHERKKCGCHSHVVLHCPCLHEFAVEIVFDSDHYSDR